MTKAKKKIEETVFVKFNPENDVYKKGYGGNGYYFDADNLIRNLVESEAKRICELCPEAFEVMEKDEAIEELKSKMPRSKLDPAEVERLEREISEVKEIISNLTPNEGNPDADAQSEIDNQNLKLKELKKSHEDLLILLQAKS